MADAVKIEIVSPERLVLAEEAQSVTVPGTEGYFTVMGEHAPLMAILKPGFVTVNTAGNAQTFYVQGGFADVSSSGLTILAEQAMQGADFDRSEIEAAITSAQEALNAAESVEQRGDAQALLDGWKNLLLEAHTGTAH